MGAGIDIGALASLDRQILLQGSFSRGKESAYLERTTNRIVAGLTADVWGPFSLLAGFQKYEKTFGRGGLPLVSGGEAFDVRLTDANEQLIMGGVRVKLAPISYLSLQYGRLVNEINFSGSLIGGASGISVTKNILSADVTVNF